MAVSGFVLDIVGSPSHNEPHAWKYQPLEVVQWQTCKTIFS
jgi:hypothetical protein